jgi:hypothetical protein
MRTQKCDLSSRRTHKRGYGPSFFVLVLTVLVHTFYNTGFVLFRSRNSAHYVAILPHNFRPLQEARLGFSKSRTLQKPVGYGSLRYQSVRLKMRTQKFKRTRELRCIICTGSTHFLQGLFLLCYVIVCFGAEIALIMLQSCDIKLLV